MVIALRFTRTHDRVEPHGLGYAFEVVGAEFLQDKQALRKLRRHRANHHGVGLSQTFKPRRNVGRLTQRQVFVAAAAAHFTHHHWAGMNADAHGKFNVIRCFDTRVERSHRLDNPQSRIDGARRIIFVRHGEAKIDEQAIAQILRNVPLITPNDFGGCLLIGAHHLAQIFGIEFTREIGRAHQVAEHHGELAPFGFRRAADQFRLGNPLVRQGFRRRSRFRHRSCGRCPNQHLAACIASRLDQQQFFLDLLQHDVVNAKEIFEGAISSPPVSSEQPYHGGHQRLKPTLGISFSRRRQGRARRRD